jgi:hypothetical protein
VHVPADFEINDTAFPDARCLIVNLSVSGAGLALTGLPEGAPAPGSVITLEFVVPGADRPTYAQGEVVWVQRSPDLIAAGVNFYEPLPLEEVIRCLGSDKGSARDS